MPAYAFMDGSAETGLILFISATEEVFGLAISNELFLDPKIEEYKSLINENLKAYSTFDSDCPEVLRDAIQHSLLAPGKRLRPLLVIFSGKAVGAEAELSIPAACAVEMIHTYSLIHDDLPAMDDDDFRRGHPTCHKQFGEANAILAGDALIPRAFEILAGISPSNVGAKCCAVLARAAGASNLVGGQIDDLASENQPGSIEKLKNIHRRKTGALLSVSCELGGIVGNATKQQLSAFRSYGENLGLAFQITDDLLDLSGERSKIGKSPGKDVASGKLTYPSLLGVDESRRSASESIEKAIESISIFDDAAELIQLAKFVLSRSN